MFHGHAARPGVRFPNDPSHSLGEDLSEPLRLSRNGRIVPNVFQPRSSMIVSESIALKLARFQNTVALPVVFEKLVDFDYKAGDFSYFDRADFRRDPMRNDPATIIQRLPDRPKLHGRISPFIELVIPMISHATAQLGKDRKRKSVVFQTEDLGSLKAFPLDLSPSLLQTFPVIWAKGCTLFVEEAFAEIERDLDLDYFHVASSMTPW
jgi:hypothetical protein